MINMSFSNIAIIIIHYNKPWQAFVEHRNLRVQIAVFSHRLSFQRPTEKYDEDASDHKIHWRSLDLQPVKKSSKIYSMIPKPKTFSKYPYPELGVNWRRQRIGRLKFIEKSACLSRFTFFSHCLKIVTSINIEKIYIFKIET